MVTQAREILVATQLNTSIATRPFYLWLATDKEQCS